MFLTETLCWAQNQQVYLRDKLNNIKPWILSVYSRFYSTNRRDRYKLLHTRHTKVWLKWFYSVGYTIVGNCSVCAEMSSNRLNVRIFLYESAIRVLSNRWNFLSVCGNLSLKIIFQNSIVSVLPHMTLFAKRREKGLLRVNEIKCYCFLSIMFKNGHIVLSLLLGKDTRTNTEKKSFHIHSRKARHVRHFCSHSNRSHYIECMAREKSNVTKWFPNYLHSNTWCNSGKIITFLLD